MQDEKTQAKVGKFADDLKQRTQTVAECAAENAETVDRDARFPTESFSAARRQRLLSVLVPVELGGDGASVSDVAEQCYMLGRECAATGMIFAMHQIMAAILVRHAQNSSWHRQLLRLLSSEQLLIASSTTEGQGGGDLRTSVSAVERSGTHIAFEKSATVMSYGAQADAILTTARRAPDAPPTDQVMVALVKREYQLERTVDWEPLGMRGTCSSGFTLRATGLADQVLPESYATIQMHTMMPVAHLTWSSVWAGIAASAADRARRCVRSASRHSGGRSPTGTRHLTRATMTLRALRALITSALERFEAVAKDQEQLESLDFQNAMSLLKVSASEMAIATVLSCMYACGLPGYRNDGDFSISRHLRDVLSSSIMINNERILSNTATASILIEIPSSLRG